MEYLIFNPNIIKTSTFTDIEQRYLAKIGSGGISRILYNVDEYGYREALIYLSYQFFKRQEAVWAMDTVLKYRRYLEVYAQKDVTMLPYWEMTSFISSIELLDCKGN